MKVYVVYYTTATKEIEIPDKFAPLAKHEDYDLFNELDKYAGSPEFYKACEGIDGDICAIETEDGKVLTEW